MAGWCPDMPAEKVEKDQKCLYGFSHFEYGNTGPIMCYASHWETTWTSARVCNLKRNKEQGKDHSIIKSMLIEI